LFNNIKKNIYLSHLCDFKYVTKYYCLVIFENVTLETLSYLSLSENYNLHLKVKRVENVKIDSNLEYNFLINSRVYETAFMYSSLCLIVGTNTRYESSVLNTTLRKRYLKGNIKFFLIGSLFNFTYPVSFIGTDIFYFKAIVEGNSLTCQSLANSSYPLIFVNSETYKNEDAQKLFVFFKVLLYSSILPKVYAGFNNVLNSSIFEANLYFVGQFSFLLLKDLQCFNSLYTINVNLNNVARFKNVLLSKIINYHNLNMLKRQKVIIYQNLAILSNKIEHEIFKNYLFFPSNNFFEEKGTFWNTEGVIKRTLKLMSKKRVKSNKQLVKKLIKTFEYSNSMLQLLKKTVRVSYTNIQFFDIKNFISFFIFAGQVLASYSFKLLNSIKIFVIFKQYFRFGKFFFRKLYKKKLIYWLNDFYLGNKDNFSVNSFTLVKCSLSYKLQVTNFF